MIKNYMYLNNDIFIMFFKNEGFFTAQVSISYFLNGKLISTSSTPFEHSKSVIIKIPSKAVQLRVTVFNLSVTPKKIVCARSYSVPITIKITLKGTIDNPSCDDDINFFKYNKINPNLYFVRIRNLGDLVGRFTLVYLYNGEIVTSTSPLINFNETASLTIPIVAINLNITVYNMSVNPPNVICIKYFPSAQNVDLLLCGNPHAPVCI